MNEPARNPASSSNAAITQIHDAILTTVHDLATSSDNTPTQLLALQKLADFPARAAYRDHKIELDLHRKQMAEHRKEIAAVRLDLTKQTFAFRQKQHEDRLTLAREKLSTLNSCGGNPRAARISAAQSGATISQNSDHLGPPARNWDDVSERARLHFDVTKEEWSRRQSLHDDVPSPLSDTSSQPSSQSLSNDSDPSSSVPSSKSAINPPEKSEIINLKSEIDIASAVHAYTSRRAEEYWSWRLTCAGLPDGEPHPPYTTQHRHCPCGKPRPCPDHENETYGEFPKYFWSTAPHFRAYALCLTDRNLPYRDPYEQVPEQFRIYDKKRRRYD